MSFATATKQITSSFNTYNNAYKYNFSNKTNVKDTTLPLFESILDTNRFDNYTQDDYIKDIKTQGLKTTWEQLCTYILQKDKTKGLLDVNNIPLLYEMGLAIQDKNKKKKSGQYYTPKDAALVMSEWFSLQEPLNICDVGCGTGSLILCYLEYIVLFYSIEK